MTKSGSAATISAARAGIRLVLPALQSPVAWADREVRTRAAQARGNPVWMGVIFTW